MTCLVSDRHPSRLITPYDQRRLGPLPLVAMYRMAATVSLYARPGIVRGQECTSGVRVHLHMSFGVRLEVHVRCGGAADVPPASPQCRCAPHPGPRSTSPAAPTAPASAPAGSARRAHRAPVAPRPARAPAATTPRPGLAARRRGPTAPGTHHPGRRPSPLRPAAELAVDGQPQRVAVEHPAALGVGWAQQHAAAQHLHGAMIAQQTHPGAMPAPSRWSKRTRNVVQGSVLIPSSGRSSRFGHEADHLIALLSGPEREDDQRFRWST
jgi:hypothetical protein